MALTKITGKIGDSSTNITGSSISGASLYGTVGTVAQNSITSATSLASVGTIGTGIWNSTFGSTANTLISGSANAANISGSFTTVSSSLASKVTTLEGTGTAQGVGTTNSPTFADITATGTVTAQEFHTEFISASVIYDSGSTRFGDTTDDTHAFTGSLTTSGSSLKIDSVGGYSGSVTSTGSFGRVEATNFSGDGSGLSGITVPTAAAISGSFEGGGSTNISGSSTSTGSFGALAVAGKVTTHLLPTADDTYDLGSATFQWRDIYTGDFHLNNTSREEGNVIDGTKGNWTIQEGRENLYLLNNETGKKFKFKLEEIE
jgi:hypothetical protein